MADKDECCEDKPIEGVLDLELGSEERSTSRPGGNGDLEGREVCDICDTDREEGNEEREGRRFGKLPLDWLTLLLFPLLVERVMYGSAFWFEAIVETSRSHEVDQKFRARERGHDV